ncbi:hypothetical protein ACJJID_08685 [Microbulbifer sp. CnH-101-G]|uniref:hypothetical protein n=1 Tax=Microbulbifer sp. CnH-101-G TaxID=3243393 RepID=UPI0040396018
MPKEMYIFLGAIVGALAAYITARVTGKKQLEIARLNAKKELKLQEDRLFDERLKSEVSLERRKLEILHVILSKIALENSQTMSFIQSDSNMELREFRERYLENCSRLHEAKAIVDIYYSEMSESISSIYGQSNIFWGYQEGVLRTEIEKDREGYESNLGNVLKAGDEIAGDVKQLQYKISYRSAELIRALHMTSQASIGSV